MKPYWTVPLACAVLSSLLMVPDVHAQFGGGRGSGGMGGGRHSDQSKGCDSGEKAGTHKTPSDAPQEMMSRDQLEYRLGTLQVDLHLTPDQATLWQSFSDRVPVATSRSEDDGRPAHGRVPDTPAAHLRIKE